MSSYITGFANTAAEWAAWANSKAETAPVIGRVWTAGRDWVVLPGTALASKAWTTVQPHASRAYNFTLANKHVVTGFALVALTAFVLGRIYFAPASLEKQLEAVQKEIVTQKLVVADLSKAAFGEGKPALADAALTDEIERLRLDADGKAVDSPEDKAYKAILAYNAGAQKLAQLEAAAADIEKKIAAAAAQKKK